MIKEVYGNELKEVLSSEKKVVCDFWAGWCGPCQMLGPVMETLSEEFANEATFIKVNIDENPEAAIAYDVMSIPTVIIFENGQVKVRNVGFMPEEVMREYLKANI